MNVGDAAMLRILDRNDRPVGAAFLHRVQRVFKAETGQRQTIGRIFQRGAVAVAPRRALKGDGAGGIGGGSGGHGVDQGDGGGGKTVHDRCRA